MLSLQPQDLQTPYYLPYRSLIPRSVDLSLIPALSSMGGPVPDHASPSGGQPQQATTVAQALEIARESPDGARDPTISGILEAALGHIWSKVLSQPDDYVMTRDEFAVFNFFQHRFAGNKVAVAARKRYWDKTTA